MKKQILRVEFVVEAGAEKNIFRSYHLALALALTRIRQGYAVHVYPLRIVAM